MNLNLPDLAAKLRPSDSSWLGLRLVSNHNFFHIARDGRPEQNGIETTQGIMVEVLTDGMFGYAATNDLTVSGLQNAAHRAKEVAQAAAPYRLFEATPAERPTSRGSYSSPHKIDSHDGIPRELIDLQLELSHSMRQIPKIMQASTMATAGCMTIELASSTGSHVKQEFHTTCSDFSVIAQDGAVIQRRSAGGFRGVTKQSGLEAFNIKSLREIAQKTVTEALELLSAPECPTQSMDLVLTPDQMMLQIHESIGHALELDRILGDERNYAGGSFVKPEDFGHLQYGSNLLNVTFDPSVSGELASYGFDDCGNPAKKEFLIQHGLLLRALGSLESQRRSNLPGVANFRACSWNRAPIDRMANLNIEPGDSSMDEIISSIKLGVLMETNRSWSIDDFRRKFQFGCEYGRMIRNGKLAEVVRNPNYRGVSVPFWNSLFRVGNAATFQAFGTPNCGKGEPSQIIWVGHASPVCAFRNVEIFGGVQ